MIFGRLLQICLYLLIISASLSRIGVCISNVDTSISSGDRHRGGEGAIAALMSKHFHVEEFDFVCHSRPCVGDIDSSIRSSYFHMMVGLELKSSFPLLLYQICDAVQYCIELVNFKIMIHATDSKSTIVGINPSSGNTALDKIIKILSDIGVKPEVWNGSFTSNAKMMVYLSEFEGIGHKGEYIYHTDLDEFPDRLSLLNAIKELDSGTCDAIKGSWVDRISSDGSLKDIKLVSKRDDGSCSSSANLEDQFPLKCNLSSSFMPLRTTKKVLLYRSTYRLASGQHDVWCDVHQTDIFKNKHVLRHDGYKNSKYVRMKQNQGSNIDGSNSLIRRNLLVDFNTSSGEDSSLVIPWHFRAACINHISCRFDRSSDSYEIFRLIPPVDRRPVFCKTEVPINHYKFTMGLKDYLHKRATTYRDLGFNWWKQSRKILDYIDEHDGKVCVHCESSHCH